MHLIEVRDVYKIYNPGENQVNALDGVCQLPLMRVSLLQLSVSQAQVNQHL